MGIFQRKKDTDSKEKSGQSEKVDIVDIYDVNQTSVAEISKETAKDLDTRFCDEEISESKHDSPRISDEPHWFELLPAVFFTAFTMTIVRGYLYTRPMDLFYWSSFTSDSPIGDYYSFYKLISILACAAAALAVMLYKVRKGTFRIKNSFVYLPICIYAAFVLLSYGMSQFKEFALWGMNDRFEGTLALLGYMVMLFYIINAVNNEKTVKRILYAVFIAVFFLGLIGITQSLSHNFLQSDLGLKLIIRPSEWQYIGDLYRVREPNNRVNQTVYNSNYVSFYLSLFLPVLTMVLFSEKTKKGKLLLTVSFALALYNFIYSQSSGGLLGLGAAAILALVILNKKLLQWTRPIAILLLITAVLGVFTFDLYAPEIKDSVLGVLNKTESASQEHSLLSAGKETESDGIVRDQISTAQDQGTRPVLNYIKTRENSIDFSFNGEVLTIQLFPNEVDLRNSIKFTDHTKSDLASAYDSEDFTFNILDERFQDYPLTILEATEDTFMIQFEIPDAQWIFVKSPSTNVRLLNRLLYLLPLDETPSIGWENNLSFGSGRGYIWSRTLPLLKNRIFFGYGADTYAIYFPQDDYAGKYSAGWDWDGIYKIVDKPHNMYLGIFTGTGGISLLALLLLWGYYIVQSFKIYRKAKFDLFLEYAGCGIFLGVCGFLVSALVNDSSVSVMPLFYGLLGVGIAINMMLSNTENEENEEPEDIETQTDAGD